MHAHTHAYTHILLTTLHTNTTHTHTLYTPHTLHTTHTLYTTHTPPHPHPHHTHTQSLMHEEKNVGLHTYMYARIWRSRNIHYYLQDFFFFFFCQYGPEGRPGFSDVSPLSGISGLSFDSIFVSAP